jgi:hypothetical protein
MLELFIMFAFSPEEDAVKRIVLIPIESEGVTRESILESMATFNLDDAHCYDPNEEIKLRGVMAAVGEERFVARIRSLAGKFQAVWAEEEERGMGRGSSPPPSAVATALVSLNLLS